MLHHKVLVLPGAASRHPAPGLGFSGSGSAPDTLSSLFTRIPRNIINRRNDGHHNDK